MTSLIQKLLIVLGLFYLVGHLLILPTSMPKAWGAILLPVLPVTALALVAAHYIKPYNLGHKTWFKIILSLFALAGIVQTTLSFWIGMRTRVLPFDLDIGTFAYVKKLVGPAMTLSLGLITAAIILAIWTTRQTNDGRN